MPPWSAEQVLALAPDAASGVAGRKLSSAAPWSSVGTSDAPAAVWGLCAGSGKNPYQTVVDLTGPAYHCSCPSRKFPCKHALGLLLLWSTGSVASAAVPEWASSWLAARAERTEKSAQSSSARAAKSEADKVDPIAAATRAQQRADRVAAGLDELNRWLTDQLRAGLSGLERAGYQQFDGIAARLVDAQAASLAGSVRRLPGVAFSGEGWPGRLLEQLAHLRLAVVAHRRLAFLPDGIAAAVRAQVGYPVSREAVLATVGVADTWQVLGLRDTVEDRLTARRVWLRGSATGRPAMILSFTPAGQPPDASLVPGTAVDADLHFYPGDRPLRALVGERRGDPQPLGPLPGNTLDQAREAYATAAAADPWVGAWPVALADVTPVPGAPEWLAVGPDGVGIPVLPGECDLWRLLAISGGKPVTIAGEYTSRGLRPFSVVAGDELVPL